MMEGLSSSETLVLRRKTRRHILEVDIPHGHGRANLKSLCKFYIRGRTHKLKNTVFWVTKPCGSCKNLSDTILRNVGSYKNHTASQTRNCIPHSHCHGNLKSSIDTLDRNVHITWDITIYNLTELAKIVR
jgi:hypothetical protein